MIRIFKDFCKNYLRQMPDCAWPGVRGERRQFLPNVSLTACLSRFITRFFTLCVA
jgi:hypothetical protein